MRVRTDISLKRYYPAGRRSALWIPLSRHRMPGPEADLKALQEDLECIAGDFREAMRTLDDEIAAGDRQPRKR
ncbi:MAG: hypothetical protein OXC56_08295 [Chloroflexi bacterium]|nr:hypothetical protein [Chloroflexota bacterium]